MPKTSREIQRDAKAFVKKWQGRGQERQDDKTFWEDLLEDVFGVPKARDEIETQKPVPFEGTTKWIDVYVKTSKVVIEQKSLGTDLDNATAQSGGRMMTPMQQGKRYYDWLNRPEQGRYIIACNFQELRIFDTFHKTAPETIITLEELPSKWEKLAFLAQPCNLAEAKERHEESVADTASGYVRRLYKELLKSLPAPTADELHSINAFCVRVVFCLFAEDAGLFSDEFFHSFLHKFDADELQKRFDHLFEVLDLEERDRMAYKYAPKELMAFPYVDGGLFQKDEHYATPPITTDVRDILLGAWNITMPASGEPFRWGDISPTNFGCIFESTVASGLRASGGMHYTTPANIHKVIDPLFFDELREELDILLRMPTEKRQERKAAEDRLEAFRTRLSSLRFLDPACGSGNFLTETYKSLHELELEAIKKQLSLTYQKYTSNVDPCKVQIGQFFGLETDDFAVSVAKASLWIAQCQMLQRTEEVLECTLTMLPLSKNANIHCCNALTTDWNKVLRRKADAPTYIIGNPPFLGSKLMSQQQRADLKAAMPDSIGGKRVWAGQGELDFVAAWYAKAAAYMHGKQKVSAAFVSTSSIVQGEQVALLWQPLMTHYKLHIAFAWRTFRWFNKADEMAHVHCIVVAFYLGNRRKHIQPLLLEEGKPPVHASNINAYLLDAGDFFISSRSTPLCNVPEIGIGNKPIDDGNYLFTEAEMRAFVAKEPASEPFFRRWYGASEFISGKPRYCLWLGDCPAAVLNTMPRCKQRVQAVIAYRRRSRSAQTRELANMPRRFHVENMPKCNYIIVPCTSSENRRYIPMGFMTPDVMASNGVLIVPDATLYHFGVLESHLHMAWMRVVGGRLKSDYRYSARIVYNNFPWPEATEEQRQSISHTAQAILDARAAEADASLADLYDPATMPQALALAHRANDRAVAALFGIGEHLTDEEIACELMRRNKVLSRRKQPGRKRQC